MGTCIKADLELMSLRVCTAVPSDLLHIQRGDIGVHITASGREGVYCIMRDCRYDTSFYVVTDSPCPVCWFVDTATDSTIAVCLDDGRPYICCDCDSRCGCCRA